MVTKKRAVIAILVALMAFVGVYCASSASASNKVTICHATGQDGTLHFVELTIDEHAVYKEQGGHFYENGTPRAGHENDYLGPCRTEETTTTTAPSTTQTTAGDDPSTTTTTGVEVTSTTSTTIEDGTTTTTGPESPPVTETSSRTVTRTAGAAVPVESQELPLTG